MFKKLFTCCCLIMMFVITPLISQSVVATTESSLSGKARVLMDYGTGQIIDEYNSTQHLPIASVTKITTLLLAFEALDKGVLTLDEVLTASEYASSMGGSQVFIDANADYTVENLLHAIVISSANDASVVIAEAIGGSEEGFVNMMNEKVQSLGAKNTNYTNCTGLPSPTAYSCANDVALVMRELVKHPKYFEISKIWMEDFAHPSGRITEMANTNKLLRSYTACDAGKTGSTNEAGFCMSATAKKGDMRLIAVVLGADNSKDRFNTCISMFNNGFANYESKKLIDSNIILDNIPTISKAKNNAEFIASEDFFTLNKKGEQDNIVANYEYNNLTAPIQAGEVVGKIILTRDNIVIKEIDIISKNTVEAKSYKDVLDDVLNNWAI